MRMLRPFLFQKKIDNEVQNAVLSAFHKESDY